MLVRKIRKFTRTKIQNALREQILAVLSDDAVMEAVDKVIAQRLLEILEPVVQTLKEKTGA